MDTLQQWIQAVGRQYVAREVGVAVSTVGHWLTGRSRPRPEHAVALERVSGGRIKAADVLLGAENE